MPLADPDIIEYIDWDPLVAAAPVALPAGPRLRDYQQDALDAIAAGWPMFRRQLVEMATGTGKTVLFAEAARREVEAGGRVLIIAHTEELLVQAAHKMEAAGLEAVIEKADSYASLSDSVVVASVQTLQIRGRLSIWPDDHFSLIVVDEAHRTLAKSYLRILNYFHYGQASLEEGWQAPEGSGPGAKVLGVTATADRGDSKSLGSFYQTCAFRYTLLDACRAGYLVRPIAKTIPIQIDLKGVRSMAGDVNEADLAARLEPILEPLAGAIAPEIRCRKTCIFLPTVATAKHMAEKLSHLGLRFDFVSGSCLDRHEKVRRFRDGDLDGICNAMLLTEGFDDPFISCVVPLRGTKVRSLYSQIVGRGTRPLPGILEGLDSPEERRAAIARSAKPDLLILDPLWLTERLSLISAMDLVSQGPLREAMGKRQSGQPIIDLLQSENYARIDLAASLAKQVQANAKKRGRTFDPMKVAKAIGHNDLANWQPANEHEARPPSEQQLAMLARHGIKPEQVTSRGLADYFINQILDRQRQGLCSMRQLLLLNQIGVKGAESMTPNAAKAATIRFFQSRQRK